MVGRKCCLLSKDAQDAAINLAQGTAGDLIPTVRAADLMPAGDEDAVHGTLAAEGAGVLNRGYRLVVGFSHNATIAIQLIGNAALHEGNLHALQGKASFENRFQCLGGQRLVLDIIDTESTLLYQKHEDINLRGSPFHGKIEEGARG